MPTIASLFARVRALKRKMARPLAQLKIQPLCDELCLEWTCARADRRPLPDILEFIARVGKTGLLGRAGMNIDLYLNRCRDEDRGPEPWTLLRAIFPWAEYSSRLADRTLAQWPRRA